MYYLSLTRPTPVENLALDEALLDQSEANYQAQVAGHEQPDPWLASHHGEVLRLWESPEPVVVLGSSSPHQIEVNREKCAADQVPILRRASGGATIVAGPGCLMYAVVLSYEHRPELRDLGQAHRFVMQQLCQALTLRLPGISVQGISDLVYQERKFSGNSLRCKRSHLLYHGTLLYDFDLSLITRYLGTPVRMPRYRDQRSHEQFVTNLPIERAELMAAVREAFGAAIQLPEWPRERMAALCFAKYLDPAWQNRF